MSSRCTRQSRSSAPDRAVAVEGRSLLSGEGGSLHYGVVRVDLHLPGSDSLKAKRALLRRAQSGLREELGCSVAEIGYQDLWQRAVLGVAITASSPSGVDRVLERVTAIIERDPRLEVLGTVELVDVLDTDVPDRPLA